MRSLLRIPAVVLFGTVLLAPSPAVAQTTATRADTAFVSAIKRLSEPGGVFHGDNIISNETSYLHVLPVLSALNVHGGAYVGVGPDQNFSYIAHLKPDIAYILDIRRDNLLEHLMYKALFALAHDRAEFLALLLGRPAPPARTSLRTDLDSILSYFDHTPADSVAAKNSVDAVRRVALSSGFELSPDDVATIERLHRQFIESGLGLRFTMTQPMPYSAFPSLRDMIVETDLSGKRASYLATEERFQFVKAMEARNLIVPVTGDFAGPYALAAIGQDIKRRGMKLSAFYTSNVEMYLFRDGGFDRFERTTSSLPWATNGVLIRAYFHRFGTPHPQAVAGHRSTQLVEKAQDFVQQTQNGGYLDYNELVTKHVVPNGA